MAHRQFSLFADGMGLGRFPPLQQAPSTSGLLCPVSSGFSVIVYRFPGIYVFYASFATSRANRGGPITRDTLLWCTSLRVTSQLVPLRGTYLDGS